MEKNKSNLNAWFISIFIVVAILCGWAKYELWKLEHPDAPAWLWFVKTK